MASILASAYGGDRRQPHLHNRRLSPCLWTALQLQARPAPGPATKLPTLDSRARRMTAEMRPVTRIDFDRIVGLGRRLVCRVATTRMKPRAPTKCQREEPRDSRLQLTSSGQLHMFVCRSRPGPRTHDLWNHLQACINTFWKYSKKSKSKRRQLGCKFALIICSWAPDTSTNQIGCFGASIKRSVLTWWKRRVCREAMARLGQGSRALFQQRKSYRVPKTALFWVLAGIILLVSEQVQCQSGKARPIRWAVTARHSSFLF